MMDYRNARRTGVDDRIDCEIEHPKFGWIPYTLNPVDTDMTVDNVALLALMEDRGDVAEYAPPTAEEWRISVIMPRADFAIAAVRQGYITESEAEDWAAGVSLPTWVGDALDAAIKDGTIPEEDRLPIRIMARTQDVIRRTDRLISVLAAAKGLSDSDVDHLFGAPKLVAEVI